MRVSFLSSFIVVASLLVSGFLVSTTSSAPYDPWYDLDDNGKIDIFDIVRMAGTYGTAGTPINKTALLLELQSRMDNLNASMLDLEDQLLALLLELQADVDSLTASVIELQSQVAALTQISGSVYRWNVFDTYCNGAPGWVCSNDGTTFGGVNPQQWTDGGATAQQMSSDKSLLRALFTQKGYGGANALVHASVFFHYSSTTGRVVVCLFRIRNTMDYAITWNPYFRYTAYNTWNERASVALNGVNKWVSDSGNSNAIANVTLSIPANRTSTVIFVSTASEPYPLPGTTYQYVREAVLAFCSNSLALPPGLEYVDDLDTATGGWDQ
jgi:hypothetical protein